jgi:DNA-binding NtrC family response regulator
MPSEFTAAVLLVERDPEIGREIMSFLTDRNYSVEWVDDGEKAFNRLDSRIFDVMVTGLKVRRADRSRAGHDRGAPPAHEGMRLMAVARERNPEICIVIIADHADIELATEAMRHGAYDFQITPLNLGKLEAVIERGVEHQRVVLAQHELRRRLDEQYGLGSLVGNSRQMMIVYNNVRAAARTDAPTLLRGEPGVGKNLIALAIHNNSPRRDEPFVKAQCSAIPEDRLDAELFGVATPGGPQRGRVEIADKGTLFINEVGALDARRQKELFRLIKQGKTQRIGDSRVIRVDVRVIASASTPIERKNCDDGLYETLHANVIDVPPLRERREDIPLLIHYFLRAASRASGSPVNGVTQNGLDLLMRYDWPGNARELRNTVEGMIITAEGGRALDARDVPEFIRQAARPRDEEIRIPLGATMAEAERILIEENMKACGYKKEACAKTLGIGLRTLYRKLKEYNLG